jgi:hypothetical protein
LVLSLLCLTFVTAPLAQAHPEPALAGDPAEAVALLSVSSSVGVVLLLVTQLDQTSKGVEPVAIDVAVFEFRMAQRGLAEAALVEDARDLSEPALADHAEDRVVIPAAE